MDILQYPYRFIHHFLPKKRKKKKENQKKIDAIHNETQFNEKENVIRFSQIRKVCRIRLFENVCSRTINRFPVDDFIPGINSRITNVIWLLLNDPPLPSVSDERQRAWPRVYTIKLGKHSPRLDSYSPRLSATEWAGQWRRGWPTTIRRPCVGYLRVNALAATERGFRKEPPRNECIRYKSEIKDEWLPREWFVFLLLEIENFLVLRSCVKREIQWNFESGKIMDRINLEK